jgi:hypothetical protein
MQVKSREDELIDLTSLHNSTKAAFEQRVAELERQVCMALPSFQMLCVWTCLECTLHPMVCVGQESQTLP